MKTPLLLAFVCSVLLNNSYAQIAIERAQREFQARYYFINKTYVAWPPINDSTQNYWADGAYGDLFKNPAKGASLVSDLAGKFFGGTAIYGSFTNYDIEGYTYIPYYTKNNFEYVNPNDVNTTNYISEFGKLERDIAKLKCLVESTSFIGMIEKWFNGYWYKSCDEGVACAANLYSSISYGGRSYVDGNCIFPKLSPYPWNIIDIGEAVGYDSRYGWVADLWNDKGKIQVDLTKYQVGSARLFITVYHEDNGVSNNPPVTADGRYHFFSNVLIGSIWQSEELGNQDAFFTLTCNGQRQIFGWYSDASHNKVIVAPDFQVPNGYYPSRDGDDDQSDCQKKAGYTFNPYTGNVHRAITDLEVWGSTGDEPLAWKRYSNSRSGHYTSAYGNAHNWNSSYQFSMGNADSNIYKQAQVLIHYPEGGENIYTQDSVNKKLWLSPAGVGKKLFQNKDTFTLQTANGYRYRFERLKKSGKTFYLLRDFRDSRQNVYTLTYQNDSLLTQVTEPAGRSLNITYQTINGKRVISKVSAGDERSVAYQYKVFTDDSAKKWVCLAKVDYGDSTHATYNYTQKKPGAHPVLEHAVDPRLNAADVDMRYVYDTAKEDGFIKEERNGRTNETMATLSVNSDERYVCYPNGRVQTYNMPGSQLGQMSAYTDGLGRVTGYIYDNNGSGFLKMEADPSGHVTRYDSLTGYGNTLQMTLPGGAANSWTRDDLDQALSFTDELGRITKYTRDENHRVTRIDYPDSSFEKFTYNNFGQVLKHTLRNKAPEITKYNDRGLKTSFKDALGNVTKYKYDAFDRLKSITDARGNVTVYLYNERGLVTRMTNADGSFQKYAYDSVGNRTSITDELKHTWKTVYDEFKRPVIKTDPLTRKTKFSYNLMSPTVCGCSHTESKPTKITSPGGKVTKIDYDVEWQKLSETVGAGTKDAATTFYEYDPSGNLIAIIDPLQKQWKYEYDERNRRISAATPLAHTTQWVYDSAGNVIKIIRPNGSFTQNKYDKMNRLIQTIDAKNEVTKMQYDAEGNMVLLTDAKNNSYSFEYDLLNRRTKMTYPGGSSEMYTYDSVSNLKTYTNRANNVCTYLYDNRNRQTSASWNDGFTPAVARSYDAAGRLRTISSTVSAIQYGYNNANELVADTENVAGIANSKVVAYQYNADGLRSQVTYPDGIVINYKYTGRNQLDSISTGATAVVNYDYDLDGNRIKKVLENGTNTTYSYDSSDRMLRVDNRKGNVSFARFDYGYDKLNRRTYMQRDNAKGDVYAYDAIDQVTGVQYDAGNPDGTPTNPVRTVSYIYDSTGNRKKLTDNGVVQNYTTNNLNQYTKTGDSLLAYTPTGNLKSFNGWTYTYDAQDRLTQAKKGSTTVAFVYDPLNRVLKRIINGVVRHNYYDGWNLIEDRNASDAVGATYINGVQVDEILRKISVNDTVYYHHDALGNVVKLTNKTGNIVEQYTYDVFGAPTIKNSNGNILAQTAYGNRFMFTGREYIKEIKLYHYRNRFYSDTLGKFLQVDPLRFVALDVNMFRYAVNNSVNHIDPYGLIDWPSVLSGSSKVLAGGASIILLMGAEVESGGAATAFVYTGLGSSGLYFLKGLEQLEAGLVDDKRKCEWAKKLPGSVGDLAGDIFKNEDLKLTLNTIESAASLSSSIISFGKEANLEKTGELIKAAIEFFKTGAYPDD
ncbi:MAG TPA: RHS repeat-associated core domain-containing protein [Parafilimonas sp.]|nr:RHS repeat-associated core domain-containing protein [Parafilimonas sp.]